MDYISGEYPVNLFFKGLGSSLRVASFLLLTSPLSLFGPVKSFHPLSDLLFKSPLCRPVKDMVFYILREIFLVNPGPRIVVGIQIAPAVA